MIINIPKWPVLQLSRRVVQEHELQQEVVAGKNKPLSSSLFTPATIFSRSSASAPVVSLEADDVDYARNKQVDRGTSTRQSQSQRKVLPAATTSNQVGGSGTGEYQQEGHHQLHQGAATPLLAAGGGGRRDVAGTAGAEMKLKHHDQQASSSTIPASVDQHPRGGGRLAVEDEEQLLYAKIVPADSTTSSSLIKGDESKSKSMTIK